MAPRLARHAPAQGLLPPSASVPPAAASPVRPRRRGRASRPSRPWSESMTRPSIRRAPLLALGLLSLAGTLGAQEIDPAQLQAERLLTTADNANPNGVLPTAPAVSSGNPSGYN